MPPGPVEAPNRELAVQRPLGLAGDVLEQLSLLREQPLRAPVEAPPGLGRLDAAARAVEELLPKPLLERADLEADRRLGDPEPLSGLGKLLRSTTAQKAASWRVSIREARTARQPPIPPIPRIRKAYLHERKL